jgi:phosphoglycerate dehydrogenase-like enzyme
MREPRILVAYRADDEDRAVYRDEFAGVAEVAYLPGGPRNERAALLRRADIVLSWEIGREIAADEYDLLGEVRLMQCVGAGVDHVPFDALPSNLMVAGNAGAYSEPMAEHVLAMTLALAKRLTEEHVALQHGEFNMMEPTRTLRGASCAILGFGGIGRATARLMRGFGMRILAINRSGRTDEEVDFIGTLTDLKAVLRQAAVIVLTLPLNHETNGLLGERELAWTRPDAIIVNVARAQLVDERALLERLQEFPELRAGIDVWWAEPHHGKEFAADNPFLYLPNVVASPHNSSMVPGITAYGARLAAENIRRFLAGEEPKNLVETRDRPPG